MTEIEGKRVAVLIFGLNKNRTFVSRNINRIRRMLVYDFIIRFFTINHTLEKKKYIHILYILIAVLSNKRQFYRLQNVCKKGSFYYVVKFILYELYEVFYPRK